MMGEFVDATFELKELLWAAYCAGFDLAYNDGGLRAEDLRRHFEEWWRAAVAAEGVPSFCRWPVRTHSGRKETPDA